MEATPAGDTMAAACPTYAATCHALPYDTSNTHRDRAALTHALHCLTCQPIADHHHQQQHTQRTARLAAEAREELRRTSIPALQAAAKVIDEQGFHRHYLWDTRQADRGTPRELCRVDIAGALAVTLYGCPTYAGAPRVLAVEQLIVDRIDAPSLAAWYVQARPRKSDAVALLHHVAYNLTGATTP